MAPVDSLIGRSNPRFLHLRLRQTRNSIAECSGTQMGRAGAGKGSGLTLKVWPWESWHVRCPKYWRFGTNSNTVILRALKQKKTTQRLTMLCSCFNAIFWQNYCISRSRKELFCSIWNSFRRLIILMSPSIMFPTWQSIAYLVNKDHILEFLNIASEKRGEGDERGYLSW